MKKTLLIVAAALAAGMISTQAQNVYSQNIVGYVNQSVPAHSYQIIGSALVNGSDINKTNGDINATLLTGLVSSPNDPPNLSSNSVMFYWGGSGYANYYYFNEADATAWEGVPSPAGWYDGGGTPANINLKDGAAAVIYNASSSDMTVTTVGTVKTGTNVTTINPGYNLINLQVPVSASVTTTNGYGLPLNLTSSPLDPPTQSLNDTIFYWGGSGFANYYYFNQADATAWEGVPSPAGFYDGGGTPMPVNPGVNQGFFLYHNGPAVQWTNSYSIQ